jgi:RES domain-containing protein
VANRLGSPSVVEIAGQWQRHVSARYADTALSGRKGYGRWGTRDGCPVLYLGRPTDSVTVEAYRHLVEPSLDLEDAVALAQQLAPRLLVTTGVAVTNILDLCKAGNQAHHGLTIEILTSDTADRAAYAACQRVAQNAYRAGCHGIIAPAASGLGETLALFTDILPPNEVPVRSAPDKLWQGLPPDPRLGHGRALRLIAGQQSPDPDR